MKNHSITSEEQHNRMLTAPMKGLILKISLPLVACQLIAVIYNTADTYFMSQISTSASAAIGVTYSLLAIIQAIGYGIGIGCCSNVSRLLGEKNNKRATEFASTTLVISLGTGVFLCAVGLLGLDPLMRLLGATDTMFAYAKDYSIWLLAGAPFQCASYLVMHLLRSEGEATLSMIGLLLGGVLNVVLDPLLIFSAGLGAAGAAIATSVSQLVSFVFLLYLFQSKRSILHFSGKAIVADWSLITSIATIGFPTTCRLGLASFAFAMLNNAAGIYGDAAVAAVTITNRIYILIRYVAVGFGQCLQTVAGYNYGAGNMARTKDSFKWACSMSTAFCIIAAALLAVFPSEVIGWFRNDPAVIEIGRTALLFSAATVPFMAYSTHTSQFAQGLGIRLPATILACCRQGICFVPLVLILPSLFGLTGVLLTQPISDMITFLICIPFQKRIFSKNLT